MNPRCIGVGTSFHPPAQPLSETMFMMISWRHDDAQIRLPLAFEQKVDIFYHRLLGWQLHVADLVSNGGKPLSHGDEADSLHPLPDSGFAVLHICLSYFETIGQYQRINPATKKDGDFFREGVHAVFATLGHANESDVKAFLDILYKNARCGLYHSSMTRAGVVLGQLDNNVAMDFNSVTMQLTIDPHILPKSLKEHLNLYCQKLLDLNNNCLRENFETQFDKDNGLHQSPA